MLCNLESPSLPTEWTCISSILVSDFIRQKQTVDIKHTAFKDVTYMPVAHNIPHRLIVLKTVEVGVQLVRGHLAKKHNFKTLDPYMGKLNKLGYW